MADTLQQGHGSSIPKHGVHQQMKKYVVHPDPLRRALPQEGVSSVVALGVGRRTLNTLRWVV